MHKYKCLLFYPKSDLCLCSLCFFSLCFSVDVWTIIKVYLPDIYSNMLWNNVSSFKFYLFYCQFQTINAVSVLFNIAWQICSKPAWIVSECGHSFFFLLLVMAPKKHEYTFHISCHHWQIDIQTDRQKSIKLLTNNVTLHYIYLVQTSSQKFYKGHL